MMGEVEDMIGLDSVLPMLQLKLGARGEYLITLLIWATVINSFLVLCA